MIDSLQLTILAVALAVMSWAVIRLGSQSQSGIGSLDIPPEVLRWQADLKRLSRELQAELNEKMAAVSALSQAYEQASLRLSDLIQEAERLDGKLKPNEQVRISA